MINKLFCAPLDVLKNSPLKDAMGISLYGFTAGNGYGSAGNRVITRCNQLGFTPSRRAWDFLSLALSVITADNGCARSTSADGWTRQLDITVAVSEPEMWIEQEEYIEKTLGFLTGDIWSIHFIPGGLAPKPPKKARIFTETAVTLLSGGLDSLIGAIDLANAGIDVVAVSQVSPGDKTHQDTFAKSIGSGLLHFQVNHNARPLNSIERTQRARSFVFIAFATLAATTLEKYKDGDVIELYIPENGLISLNIPLTPSRIGSLSTRTTHPYYIKRLQSLFEKVGLKVHLFNPYQFATKGEMLRGCKNQKLLRKYSDSSTSCGRFARNGFTQCGKCIPCLIRRAAFYKWGKTDTTKYVHSVLTAANKRPKDFEDIRSAGIAIESVARHGIERWIGGSLNAAQLGDIAPYQNLAKRGLSEIKRFLVSEKAL